MKKHILALIVLVLALASFGCKSEAEPTIICVQPIELHDIGETAQLFPTRENAKPISHEKLIWETSDYTVATVSKDGLLTLKGYGSAIITVSLKSDLSVRNQFGVFCPYPTQNEGESSFVKDGNYANDSYLEGLLGYTVDSARTYIAAILDKSMDAEHLASLLVGKSYLFSYVLNLGHGDNVVIAELCDWTNERKTIKGDIDIEGCVKNLIASQGFDCEYISYGETFISLSEQATSLYDDIAPIDNVWYFDLMDPDYQYRIVLRCDADFLSTVDVYQSGLFPAIGEVLKGLVEEGLEGFNADKAKSEKNKFDVYDVKGLRICVERRKK